MYSEARTVDEYLAVLPADRREDISKVRDVILANLPQGYAEVMNWGMITYQVPLDVYPDTYNGKPLMYAALASQKNYMALYIMSIYMSAESREQFEAAYKATGKRFDAGKSCIRFKKVDDLPLELIAESIAALEVEDFVDRAKKIRSQRKGGAPADECRQA
ncbi:MAG: iron chaperone [Planctomycetota bacterium]|jgi:uncharacterized protein YdhG (YjbR/CyaY superfamily)